MFDKEMKNSLQGLFVRMTHEYFVKIYSQMMNEGIHPGQIPMLRLLYYEKGLNQKEIAKRLRIKPPTVTMTIRRLEKSGYVKRLPDEKDQRVIRVVLTQEGEKANERIKKVIEQNEKIIFSGFSQSEICLIRRFFNQMLENIESIPAGCSECGFPGEILEEGHMTRGSRP